MVYIELVIANNLIANSVILEATKRLIGFNSSWKRQLLPVLLSTILGVALPTVKVTDIACLAIKLLSAVLIAFCLTGRVRFKTFMITLVVFYACSFCLAGGVSALLNSFSFIGRIYSCEELTFCILGGSVVFSYLIWQSVEYIKLRVTKRASYATVINKNGAKISLDSFVDSGNEITYKGQGVIFASINLKKDLRYYSLDDYVLVKTATGEKIFEIYKLPLLEFENKSLKDVPLVFSEGIIGENKLILHRGY